MNDIERRVNEVLHNLNWLLEAHNSFAELVEIDGNKVVIRCTGACSECETDCVGVAFKERMPEIELILE
jgi:Fe-S cluster biogenesis protein NfuA